MNAPGRRAVGARVRAAGLPARHLRSRLQRAAVPAILAVTAALLAVWCAFAVQAGVIAHRPRLELVLAVAGLAGGAACLARGRESLARVPRGVFLTGVLTLVVGLRLAWVVVVPTLPVSDFKMFAEVADNLLRGVPHRWPAQQLGIVLQLAGTFALSGGSQLAARIVNVLWAVPTMLALLALGRRTVGEAAARTAAILFALWPADIMLRGTFTTEIGFVPFYLGALVMVIDATRSSRPLRRLALAGVLLGLGDLYRPVGGLLVAVSGAWLTVRTRRPWRRVAIALAVLGAAWAVTTSLRTPAARALGFDTGWSWLAGNVLMGSNIESRGQWNQADSDLFFEALGDPDHRDGGRALRVALAVAARRAVERPWETVRMQAEKVSIVWSDDSYGAYWSTLEVDDPVTKIRLEWWRPRLYALSQYAFLGFLGLALAGTVGRMRSGMPSRDLALPLLVVLTFVAVHVVLEAQNRYHYPWTYPQLLLAGWGAVRISGCRPSRRPPDRPAP